jgi:hypothetical protein
MIENKILQLLHHLNIENLDERREEGFNYYFKSIINSSHFIIRISYFVLLGFLTLYWAMIKLLFLSKKSEYYVFSKGIIFFNKLIFLRDILKLIKIYSIIYNYDK